MSHIHMNIEHLSFSYEKKTPILQDISFFAGERESIGIIGANGVGKSTLINGLFNQEVTLEGEISKRNKRGHSFL